jgi:hypothetical protein
MYVVTRPGLGRRILVADQNLFVPFIEEGRLLIGNGLASCPAADHAGQRPLTQPAFHHTRLPHYARIMQDATMEVTRSWRSGQWCGPCAVARWPYSTNPHLLITRVTAHDPAGPPMSPFACRHVVAQLGSNARTLRMDRTPNEARTTAEAVHLMEVFGILDRTAMHYLAVTHPEKFTDEPIGP